MRWAATQPPSPLIPAEVESHLETWRNEVDPRDVGRFETRLARDGLTLDSAVAVFTAPEDADLAEPAWWPSYQRLVAALARADGAAVDAQLDDDPAVRDTIAFAHLLFPISSNEIRRLAAGLGRPVADQVQRDLHLDLLSRLSQVTGAALSAVMWRDVPFGAKLLAQAGVTDQPAARERYLAFCDHHRRNGLSEILLDYPVLGRLLATLIDQWHRSSATMLTRVAGDRTALAEWFGVPVDQPLGGVTLAAGDRHNGGSSVALLTFGDRTVVYKPRSVQLEALYAAAAGGLSRHSDGPDLYAPAVILRGDGDGHYGYVEFVEAKPCDPGELSTFYRNAGRLLALLYVLMATDCHHENLIAAGDQLVLIDAETLLLGSAHDLTDLAEHPDTMSTFESGSVVRVGMLPTWLWLEGRQCAVDISTLGVSAAGERHPGSGWTAINTDAMVAGRRTYEAPHPTSLPGEPGGPNRVADYVEAVVDGFTDAYAVLIAGRTTWLPDLLTRVESAHNRAVLRATYVYASLIASLVEPSALRSMVAAGMVCERLTRGYLDAQGEAVWPLVAADQDALLRLDVPYYTWPLTGGSTRWWCGELQGWPEQDQLAQVRAHLDSLDGADLRLQVALIRASLRARGVRMRQEGTTADLHPTDRVAPGPATSGPSASATDLAQRSLQATADAAFDTRGHATWMGPMVLPDGVHANVASIGPGLYDGRMGLAVGLLLWARAEPTGADQAVDLCRRTLMPLVEALAHPDGVHRLVLTYGTGIAGVGGLLRGLAFVRGSGVEVAGVAQVERAILDFLTPAQVEADPRIDVIAGPAGLVAPLARMLGDESTSDVPRQHVLDLIGASARVIAARQEPDSGGWLTMRDAPPLTGLAHGASGIALALIEAAVALGDTSLLPPALRGLGYEADLFDADVGNWPDLRPDVNASVGVRRPTPGFMLGWCAGAPGIALVRQRLLELLPGHSQATQWRAELYRAADTTAGAPLLGRDHLCCGNLGRVAILRLLANHLGDNRWDGDVARIVDGVRLAAGAGLPRSMLGETIPDLPEPGLFTGLPGEGAALFGDVGWVPRLML
ncbi:MAG: hypothetical protein QG597_3065 [Actinomycetota bacterium]|nr:hypothetical protein [Actinomycetota bacterium]